MSQSNTKGTTKFMDVNLESANPTISKRGPGASSSSKNASLHSHPHVPYTRQSKFHLIARSIEEENEFDLVKARNLPKPSGVFGSVVNVVKGALGAGILSGHVAFMKGGLWLTLPATVILGVYMTYCLYMLVSSAQKLCKRTRVPSMTYPDLGEAAFQCTELPVLVKLAKPFRYFIDAVICFNSFGSCACYQLIIAKSIKQLVENQQETSTEPLIPGYPNLKVYIAIVIIPCVLICLLRYLKWLAPISFIANGFIGLCIVLTIYYAIKYNPSFEDLGGIKTYSGFFQFMGMSMLSISAATIIMPVENNMKDPNKILTTLVTGMVIVVLAYVSISFFGYVAFRENSESPITLNFPMGIMPKIVKVCIILMIYGTHALNFWPPFQLVFHYLQRLHSEKNRIRWELFYRTVLVTLIGVFAVVFPNVESLIGFFGATCLPFLAFIWPVTIELAVNYKYPGFGRYKWRLWKGILLILIGLLGFGIGTYVNAIAMYHVAAGRVQTAVNKALRNGEEFAFQNFF